jgi:threonine dehydrogenase-like Zn-dependent dehydrogenase
MSERWRIEPEYLVRVDAKLGHLGVLLEPTTVVAKAWAQIVMIGQRTFWEPHTVLVVGAGPIGLLAAMIGVQLGREVHVLDRVNTGPQTGTGRAARRHLSHRVDHRPRLVP